MNIGICMNFNEIFFMMAIFFYGKLLNVKYYQLEVATARRITRYYGVECIIYGQIS